MPKETVTTIQTEFVVGLLLRGSFRKMLDRMVFEVPGSRYKEIKWMLDSTFLVEAPHHTIKVISNWAKEVSRD